jgi:hypothetical protein
MFTTSRFHTLAALLAAALLAATATTARADDDGERFVAAHSVKITSTGFDFGSHDFLLGAPQKSGELAWWVDADNAPLASLDGYLHLNDVEGACAKMRLRYKTSANVLVAERFGGTVCVDDDKHHTFDVSLSPYANRKVQKVEISLMRQFASNGWASVGSKTIAMGPYGDPVKLTTNGFDFGNGSFLGNGPTGSGTLSWTWTTSGIRPHLDGTLHLKDVAGACARMKLEDFDADGDLVGTSTGGNACATDDALNKFTVDLGTFSDWGIVKTKVSLQTLGADDVWRTTASTTAYASTENRIQLTGGSF